MEWYEHLGLEEDPFQQESRIIGRKKLIEEIFYNIEAGNITIVEGSKGIGKTMLLKEVINNFGGEGKVIYVSGKRFSNGINIERLLNKRYGFFGWLFNRTPKNMILLMDDVENLTEKNCERIKYYFDQNYLKSVVFTTKDIAALNFTPSLLHRVKGNFKLEPLTEEEAISLVKTKSKNLLPEEEIKSLLKESNHNYKIFLIKCKEKCRTLFSNKGIAK